MNVYCVKCGGEMEIMEDLGSELKVYPCGCGGNGKPKRQPTLRATDPPSACPSCGVPPVQLHVKSCPFDDSAGS